MADKCHSCGKPVKDCSGHDLGPTGGSNASKCHVCGKPVADCPGH